MPRVAIQHRGPQPFQPGDLVRHRSGGTQVKCIRFFAALASGTLLNQMFGPPQPAASTKALSEVESSSTSDPKTAAQNVASARASTASN
jgi:hypothetical protein